VAIVFDCRLEHHANGNQDQRNGAEQGGHDAPDIEQPMAGYEEDTGEAVDTSMGIDAHVSLACVHRMFYLQFLA